MWAGTLASMSSKSRLGNQVQFQRGPLSACVSIVSVCVHLTCKLFGSQELKASYMLMPRCCRCLAAYLFCGLGFVRLPSFFRSPSVTIYRLLAFPCTSMCQ